MPEASAIADILVDAFAGPEDASAWQRDMYREWARPVAEQAASLILATSFAENARLRLAIERIFRDRRESDKVSAECLSVMPELCHNGRFDPSRADR